MPVLHCVTLRSPADEDPAAAPIRYEIHRRYTALGQPRSVHLLSADGETIALDHRIETTWNEHGQLASVKSLAGEFVYEYDETNPALLTTMTGPAHSVTTTYEPHRNLITSLTNRISKRGTDNAKRGMGFQPMDRRVATEPESAKLPEQPPIDPANPADPISSYAYANDLLGRRETIAQGGSAFTRLALGAHTVEVAYNDRSEVIAANYRRDRGSVLEFRISQGLRCFVWKRTPGVSPRI